MAPKEKKTKAQIAAAAASARGKKKWSKGRTKEKLNNSVLFDKPTWDKFLKEMPKVKLITPSVVSERFRINVTLAKQAIKYLEEKRMIRCVAKSRAQQIYTRASASEE